MKTRFAKLAALLLVVMIALSGCSLIEIDQEMENAEVVATVNGVNITKGQVMSDYNYMIMLYQAYGITITSEILEGIKADVLDMFALQEVIRQKAVELGLVNYDDPASFAEPDAEAAAYFEELLSEHAEHVATTGMSEEAAREKQIAHLAAEGTTLERIQESYRQEYVYGLVEEYVASSVTVSEDEVKAAYDAQVAADEEQYASSTYLYETAHISGEPVAWNPEGYRTVKHILFLTSDEQTTAQAEISTQITAVDAEIAALDTAAEGYEASLAELNAKKADLEAQQTALNEEIIASFKEKTDAVYARLDAGEAFDALMAELGEDPGMKSEPSMTTGYYVTADSSTWDINFRDAAMALEAIGDVSQPVLTASGVHIICYNSDVAAGAVPFESLRDVLTDSLLTAKQENAFNAACAEWMNAATIKTFPKVIK